MIEPLPDKTKDLGPCTLQDSVQPGYPSNQTPRIWAPAPCKTQFSLGIHPIRHQGFGPLHPARLSSAWVSIQSDTKDLGPCTLQDSVQPGYPSNQTPRIWAPAPCKTQFSLGIHPIRHQGFGPLHPARLSSAWVSIQSDTKDLGPCTLQDSVQPGYPSNQTPRIWAPAPCKTQFSLGIHPIRHQGFGPLHPARLSSAWVSIQSDTKDLGPCTLQDSVQPGYPSNQIPRIWALHPARLSSAWVSIQSDTKDLGPCTLQDSVQPGYPSNQTLRIWALHPARLSSAWVSIQSDTKDLGFAPCKTQFSLGIHPIRYQGFGLCTLQDSVQPGYPSNQTLRIWALHPARLSSAWVSIQSDTKDLGFAPCKTQFSLGIHPIRYQGFGLCTLQDSVQPGYPSNQIPRIWALHPARLSSAWVSIQSDTKDLGPCTLQDSVQPGYPSNQIPRIWALHPARLSSAWVSIQSDTKDLGFAPCKTQFSLGIHPIRHQEFRLCSLQDSVQPGYPSNQIPRIWALHPARLSSAWVSIKSDTKNLGFAPCKTQFSLGIHQVRHQEFRLCSQPRL